jgi:hypothetical protein
MAAFQNLSAASSPRLKEFPRPPRGRGRWGWATSMLRPVADLASNPKVSTGRLIIVAVTTVAVVGLLVASTMIGTLLLLTHLLG